MGGKLLTGALSSKLELLHSHGTDLTEADQWVQEVLVAVKGLYPERFEGVRPSLAEFGQQLGSKTVLRSLREVAQVHLGNLPAPLGFRRMSSAEAKKQACSRVLQA